MTWKHYLSIGYETGSVQGQSGSFDLDRPWSVAKATRKRIDDHWVPRFWDPLSLIILVDGICFIDSISIRVDCVIFLVHFRAFEAIVKLLSAPISPMHIANYRTGIAKLGTWSMQNTDCKTWEGDLRQNQV